jgi:hypothetical protein
MIQVGDRVVVSGWRKELSCEALVIGMASDESDTVWVQPADGGESCSVARMNVAILPGGSMLEEHAMTRNGPMLRWSAWHTFPVEAF